MYTQWDAAFSLACGGGWGLGAGVSPRELGSASSLFAELEKAWHS